MKQGEVSKESGEMTVAEELTKIGVIVVDFQADFTNLKMVL